MQKIGKYFSNRKIYSVTILEYLHNMYYETEASRGSGTFLKTIFLRRTRLCHASTLAAATAAGSSSLSLSCSAHAVTALLASPTAATTAIPADAN